MLPYLRIRGTPDYWSELDSEISAALGRRKTPQQALDDCPAAWEKITDRLGRRQQLELYRAGIGYRALPPARADGRWRPATSIGHAHRRLRDRAVTDRVLEESLLAQEQAARLPAPEIMTRPSRATSGSRYPSSSRPAERRPTVRGGAGLALTRRSGSCLNGRPDSG